MVEALLENVSAIFLYLRGPDVRDRVLLQVLYDNKCQSKTIALLEKGKDD